MFSITGLLKWQSTAQKNGARVRRAPFCSDSLLVLAAVGLLGSDPVNIRTGDADVGKLTISEVGKLPLHGFVPLPGLIEVGNRCQHGLASFPRRVIRSRRNLRLDIAASVHCTIIFAAVQPSTKRMPVACLREAFLTCWPRRYRGAMELVRRNRYNSYGPLSATGRSILRRSCRPIMRACRERRRAPPGIFCDGDQSGSSQVCRGVRRHGAFLQGRQR